MPPGAEPRQGGSTQVAPPVARAPEADQAAPPEQAGELPALPDAQAPAVPPAVEKPPPSAGRMVRLRGRLARSQKVGRA
jgi:fused signal recognition particle receptor